MMSLPRQIGDEQAEYEASDQCPATETSKEHDFSALSRPTSFAGLRNSEKPLQALEGNIGCECDQFLPHHGGEVAESPDYDRFKVTFDDDQDPMCPRSMPLVQKWIIVILICTGTLCVTCASSIYTTTYTQMNAEFGTTTLIATLGLSSFVLGIALGPLFTSPLSEWYGRRPIYLVSWSLFIVWTIPPAVAKNIQTMVIARFFTGFAGGTFLSVAGGTVGDVFSRHEIHVPMTLVSSAPFIGPCLGPLIGGFINSYSHWRWTYYVVIIWSVVLLLLLIFFAPETYHPMKLQAKVEMLRKQTGDDRYKVLMENAHTSRRRALALSLLRPFKLLLLEPMCLCLDLYSAILLGMLYLFFGAFHLVFGTTYDMNLWQVGLTFLGIITGMIVAALSTPIWPYVKERLLIHTQDKELEATEPEYRLVPAIPGGILIPIGLFWFGWTVHTSVHWIIPIIGSAVFGCGMLLAFTGIFTFLVDAYPKYAASALAGNGFARCSFAAAFPLFGIQMYEKLGYQWATSLLAFLTVAMMPFPWLLFKYGKLLRAKSKFAVNTH